MDKDLNVQSTILMFQNKNHSNKPAGYWSISIIQ